MIIKTFLLFAMRIVAAIVILPASAYGIVFALLLLPPDPGLGELLRVQIYERWSGVVVCYILLIAVCAGIDYATGALKWFEEIPGEIRYLGCAALTLSLTLLMTLFGSSPRYLDRPDFGTHNIVVHEIYLLAPVFMSELIKALFRGW